MERWPWGNKGHVIVDAGFSGVQMHDLLLDLGCFFTASINQGHKKWLVDLLRQYCEKEEHIAVVDGDGLVWSFARDTFENAEHFVVSNAFKREPKRVREVAITPDQIKQLSKVGGRGLNLLADQLGLPSLLDDFAMATSIATFLNSKVPLTPPVTGASSVSNASGGGGAAQPNMDGLEQKTVKELQSIARDLHLKPKSQTKKDIIASIRDARAISSTKLESMKRNLGEGRRRSGRTLHDEYVNVFNSIDIHDKRWYQFQNHHTISTWRAKFAMSLLYCGVINSAVIYCHYEKVTNLDFCFALGEALVWD